MTQIVTRGSGDLLPRPLSGALVLPLGVDRSAVAGGASGQDPRSAPLRLGGRGLDQRAPHAAGAGLRAGGRARPLGVVVVGAEGELELVGHALLVVLVVHQGHVVQLRAASVVRGGGGKAAGYAGAPHIRCALPQGIKSPLVEINMNERISLRVDQ